MTTSKLFVTKAASDRHSCIHKFKVTADDDLEIRKAAAIRQLNLSEYLRRTALGRTANVDFETDIVIALSACVKTIRNYHAALIEHGHVPPDDVLRPVITKAGDAMDRIQGQ